MQMEKPQFFTVAQVAERYNICKLTVLRKLKSGDLTGFRVGKIWRITGEDLKIFENKRGPQNENGILQH